MRLNVPLLYRQRVFVKVGELTKQYANLPESYINRSMEHVYWRTPKDRRYLRAVNKKDLVYFSRHRPWTEDFRRDNLFTKRKKEDQEAVVEPIRNWNFFRGDIVQILKGKDKGKQGVVIQIFQERNWVIVEGLNCKYKYIGQTEKFPGVLTKEEQPLLVTNEVTLIDPTDSLPTEIEWRFTEDGDKVRVSKRTGRIIPMPTMAEETYDYKQAKTYKENEHKDTPVKEMTVMTYQGVLGTFEMDVMDEMGIKEDRVPKKTYWY